LYDELREAVPEQYARVAVAVDSLLDADFDRPTRLGDWRVSALVAHLAGNLGYLLEGLAAPAPADGPAAQVRPAAPGDLVHVDDLAGRSRIAALAEKRAAGCPPAELRDRLRNALEATTCALDAELDRVVVIEERGPILLSDYLVTRCTEGVVHGLDLAAATGVSVEPEPRALRAVVRLLADRLVERAPGRSVEVRIPGPAGCAVQCVDGPRHTRGTPGSVVEIRDAVSWVELATGRLEWAAAVADGRVTASGERADLTPYLPVLS